MKKLLIYIPSYNRYELLCQQIEFLIQDIDSHDLKNTRVIVNDNASTDERYLTLPNRFQKEYFSFHRNDVNIGLVGNLIRGFEQADWDYIWILSDDDIVEPGALKRITGEIQEGTHDFYYLRCNIHGNDRVRDGEIIRSLEGYLSRFATLSMMGLISATIYPIRIKRYLEYMYIYGYTIFPFLAGMFKLMESESFSLKCIGGKLLQWRPDNRSWSHIYWMALGNILYLAETIGDKKAKKILIEMHLRDFGISHYFPFIIRDSYNLKKGLTQVGLLRLAKLFLLTLAFNLKLVLHKTMKSVS